jgi:hypothetical protein
LQFEAVHDAKEHDFETLMDYKHEELNKKKDDHEVI